MRQLDSQDEKESITGGVWRLRRESSSDNFNLKEVKLIQQIKKK